MNIQCFNKTVFGSELNRQTAISTAMNGMAFNTTPFCGGRLERVPSVPVFWGAPPNFGGGWASSGIVGTYYSNNNYTGASFQRSDVRIDMPLTTVLPGGSLSTDPVYAAVPATNFSVKWIGNLIPKYTLTYIFKVKTGGTLALKIAGTTVATATSSSGWVSASQALTANTTYAVEVDYVQGTGPWGAQVHWMGGGAVPFPEEAIGPATPIGVNLDRDDQDCPANGALIAQYQGPSFSGNGPVVDSSGWPTGDFSLGQMSTPYYASGSYAFPNVGFASDGRTGVWAVSFTGSAALGTNNTGLFLIGHDDGQGRTQVSLNGLTYYAYPPVYQAPSIPLSSMVYHATTGTGYNPATNTTFVLFDLRNSGWDNIAFTSTDRSGRGAPGGPSGTAAGNGLTNVVCMRPDSIGSTTSLRSGLTINPPFLAAMAPYVCIRNLGSYAGNDFVASVASPPTDWNNRPIPVFNCQASNHVQYPNGSYLPWEYRVMACNQAGKDLYVNLPQTASGNLSDTNYASSYIYKLASLLKNGSTFNGVSYPGLLPHLNVYIEYGNENWNFSAPIAPQGAFHNIGLIVYNNKQANTSDWQQYHAMGGDIVGPNDNSMNVALWSALKVKDASDIFRMVYGDAVMPGSAAGYNPDPRIRPIYEWQYGGGFGGSGSANDSLSQIQYYYGVAANHVYWGGGGGWYLDMNPGDATADAIFADISPASALAVWSSNPYLPAGETNTMQEDTDILAQYGLHHVGYEGGFDFGTGSGGIPSAQQQASNDARIIPYVQLVLNSYFQAGGALPLVFDATGGPYGFVGQWAVIDGIWDEPPYATAPPKLQAYLDLMAALPAAVSAPSAWPVAPSYFPVQQGRQAGRPLFQTQTFVVQNAGFYSAGFTTATYWSNAIADIAIAIDGTMVGSTRTQHLNGSDSFYVPVWLAVGVHCLTLTFANPNPSTGWSIVIDPWGVIS